MAIEDIRTMASLAGTGIVLHRGTDIDLREFRLQDLAVVILLAYGTRRVMTA